LEKLRKGKNMGAREIYDGKLKKVIIIVQNFNEYYETTNEEKD
jgi:hypothetical protein